MCGAQVTQTQVCTVYLIVFLFVCLSLGSGLFELRSRLWISSFSEGKDVYSVDLMAAIDTPRMRNLWAIMEPFPGEQI